MPKAPPKLIDVDRHGRVVKWKSDRGYGFIRTEAGSDVFAHVRSIAGYPTIQDLGLHQEVTFDLAEGEKGPVAVNIRPRA